MFTLSSSDLMLFFHPVPALDTDTTPAIAASAPAAMTPTTNPGSDLSIPQFAEGYHTGGKPKASDYEPVICALLIRTMCEYEAMVSTKDGFLDPLVHGEWAKMCWQQACNLVNERYQLTSRMSSLVHDTFLSFYSLFDGLFLDWEVWFTYMK
jgi:hypothetical protein